MFQLGKWKNKDKNKWNLNGFRKQEFMREKELCTFFRDPMY